MLQLVDIISHIGFIEMLILFLYAARYYLFSLVSFKNREKMNCGGRGLNPIDDAFVSVLLPIYNEVNVVDRLLTFCTSFDFPNFEVIVIDDSTDETSERLGWWSDDPRVKIVHRNSRNGWKGGALNSGLKHLHPDSTHILVLDADFVPPSNLLQRFLSRFKDRETVAVQGYQLHDLNAEENWVTKGIRVWHSLSNIVELTAKDKLGLLTPLTGSVFMVRTEVLRELGFNGSITEDWELTLRLYEEGYKVEYDPTLTASAECSNSLRKFLTQTARCAEGNTRDFRTHFRKTLGSSFLTLREKLEFLFQGCKDLNSVVIMALILGGFMSLPSYNHALSLSSTVSSLFLTAINISSLVFAMTTALLLENRLKDVAFIPNLLILGYIVTPVIAYASLKGLLTGGGKFHRTFKTGKVTSEPILNRLKEYFS